MKYAGAFPWILVFLLSGCAATVVDGTPEAQAAPAEDGGAESEREKQGLARRVDIASARVGLAHLELKAFKKAHDVRVRHAAAELDIAKAKLAAFLEAEAPNRIAGEKLNLQTAKDRAKEAADELEQIEIMYKDQDLDDLTAEFVVSRGRRSAARAAARLKIMESELRAVEEREIPQEERRLTLAVDKAMAALEALEHEGDMGLQNKEISIREAEGKLEDLQQELVELEEKSS